MDTEKQPNYQKALDAYLRGELRPLVRAPVLRPECDYEQNLIERTERARIAKAAREIQLDL